MLRVQIGTGESMPEEVFDTIKNAFLADAVDRVFPIVKATCIETGQVFPVGYIGNIGRLENGDVLADLMYDIQMEINEDNGKIEQFVIIPKHREESNGGT